MKTTFKVSAAALLFAMFTLSASAQPQQPQQGQQGRGRAPQQGKEISAEKMAEIATDKLDQTLELTDAQETKIYAINLKYAELREANKPERAERPERPAKGEKAEKPNAEQRKEARPNGEEMKAKAEAAQAQKRAQMVEIMKVLTDEQKVDYAIFIGKAQQKRGDKGGMRPGQGAPAQGQNRKAPQGQRGKGGERGQEQPQHPAAQAE